MNNPFIIGTRGSDLALWQAHYLQAELEKKGYSSELKIIKTKGDQIQHISLEKIEGKGFFTKELEDALLNGTIDVAVHSHKDLPTEMTPGLKIAGVSYREDPSELLLIRKESVDMTKELFLKDNAIVGTSASRRKLQLLFFRPDLQIEDIRGNVPTRIEKLRKGNYDATLLAAAGVERLQLDCSDLHVIKLQPHYFIPAPAQGVLAYQCRENDELTTKALNKIHKENVAEEIFVEREVMRLFKGGCHMPLGMYCKKNKDIFEIWGMQSSGTLNSLKRIYIKSDNTSLTAETIFNKFNTNSGRSVFISTAEEDAKLFKQVLMSRDFNVTAKSLVKFRPLQIQSLPDTDWYFFTSKNGVRNFLAGNKIEGKIKIASIGEETSNELRKHGILADFTGNGNNVLAAREFMLLAEGTTVLFPQAVNASGDFSDLIKDKCNVILLPIYINEPMTDAKLAYFDILVFTSALNADAYFKLNRVNDDQVVIAIGESTKKHLLQLGVKNILTPPFKNFLSLADLICGI